jgi:hypothetical protein
VSITAGISLILTPKEVFCSREFVGYRNNTLEYSCFITVFSYLNLLTMCALARSTQSLFYMYW